MSVQGIRPVSQIPILGQPVEIHGWFPTVMVTCKCVNQPLLIVGLDAVAECPQCHAHYRVEVISMSRQTNEATVSIGRVVAAPVPALGQPT